MNFNLTRERSSKTRSFIHRPGQIHFDDLCVSLPSQARQADPRSGHIALGLSLALAGGVLGQPGLRGVVSSQGTQTCLRRMSRFAA